MSAVVQLSFHLDRRARPPAQLLDAWPSLTGAAVAAARAGADVAVVQAAHEDAEIHRDGVTFHFVRERPGLRRGTPGTRPARRSAPAVAERVRALAPRLVHVHGLSLPGHARRVAAALPGVRLLAQDHADALPRPWRLRGARRDMASLDAVAFTHAAQAAPFLRAGLLRPGIPIFQVLEASTRFRAGDPTEARLATGIRGDPCFVWTGRLDPNKDPLTVLEGFARAVGRFPDPRLWMCHGDARGDAPLLSVVRRRIARDPRLRERVRLLGRLPHDRVELLLRGADYLLQGSHREGSGYGVIEALACGVTPVVTDIPSLRAIVGDAGLLWPPGDADALARRLGSLAGRTRAPLRAAALGRFDRSLSWDAVGHQLAAAYQTVLAGTPAQGVAVRGRSRAKGGVA